MHDEPVFGSKVKQEPPSRTWRRAWPRLLVFAFLAVLTLVALGGTSRASELDPNETATDALDPIVGTVSATADPVVETYGYAAAYSPDPERPGKALLPFDVATGRLIDDVWAQWLRWDPVRMAPRHADALRSMKRICLDAGKSDEWFLDLGAQAFSAELDKLGVEHTLELFEGKHGGITYRYPGAIRELVLALR